MKKFVAVLRLDSGFPIPAELQPILVESDYERCQNNVHTFGWTKETWNKLDVDCLDSWSLTADIEKYQFVLNLEPITDEFMWVEKGSKRFGLNVEIGGI